MHAGPRMRLEPEAELYGTSDPSFLSSSLGICLMRHLAKHCSLQTLATCIRRVARLLWSVHLSFQEGFDKVEPSPRYVSWCAGFS